MNLIFRRETIFIVLIFFILIFFFNKSINTLLHVFDGGHHGSILLESLDIINNKIPYKEIFLQYGYLSALINSFFLKIFNKNIIGIYHSTSFFYFSSIFLIGLISWKFSNYKAFIFSIIICVFNHPIPQYPWPNYSAFFFLTISVFLFDNSNIKLFFTGFFLAIACLCRENFYYFVIPSLICINFFLYIYNKQKIKNLYLCIGFLLPLLFFLSYLNIYSIFFDWLNFQKLPFIYLNKHYEMSFIYLLWKFISFFFSNVLFNLVTTPQYLPIFVILLFNIYVLFDQIFFKKNIKIIFICLLSLSSIVVSINLELFRLYTSVLIGLPVFFYRINFLSSENKFFMLFIILFISFMSFYYYPNGNIKAFNKIDYLNSIEYKNINYFKNQKLPADKWKFLINLKKIDKEIISKCDVGYVINLTPNAFLLSLSELKRIQLVPVFNEYLGRNFPLKFQKNLAKIFNEKVANDDIYIISMENNINEFKTDLTHYKISHKLEVTGLQGSEVRIFVPIKCYNNL